MAQNEEQSLELKIKSSANDVTKNLQKLNDVAYELFSTMSKAEQATTSMKKFAKATEKGSRLIVETTNGAEKMIRVFDATGKLRSLDVIPQKIKKIKRALDEAEASAKMDKLSGSTDKFAAKLEESGFKVASINKVVGATDEVTRAVIKATNEFETLQYTIDEAGNIISIKKVTKATKDLGEQAGKSSKKMNKLFDMGKIYAIWNYTKKIRDLAANTISSAIDYVETENKFNVSMQSMSKSGYKFVNTISETFGMAREEIMNYQATYNNIMKSLSGITDETAYQISESITKMAIDYSSLYNVSTNQAMTKFQSALVGSVRPIRTESGYDITETTIGEKAKQLGIERPTRQLTQMEKRLLRIMVLMDQMKETSAMGDFARTIEQPANQLKILSNQLKELGVWIGNVFLGALKDVLPYINGFVMALKEVAKMLAILFGYKSETNGGPLADANDSTGGIADNLGSAVSSAKELKRTLMGFDVLNVIQTPTTGGGAGGSFSGIDPKILEAMGKYDNLMDGVKMKALDIRDRIMEWLGYTKLVNEETGEVTWELQDGGTNAERIRNMLIAITAIVAGLVGAKLIGKIPLLMGTIIKNIGAIGAALAAIGIISYIGEINEGIVDIDKAMDAVIMTVTGIGLAVGAVFGLVPGLIAALIASIAALIYTLVTKWESFTVGFQALWQHAMTKVKSGLSTLGNAFKTTWQSAQDGWDIWMNKLKKGISDIHTKWKNFQSSFTLPKIKTPHFTWSSTPAKGWMKEVLEALNIPAALPKLSVEWYAQGGFPDVGEMFVAREAGPELVGTIGNKSAVVNNQQIVQAVSQGVAEAVSSVMGSNSGSYHLYIDGQEITDVVTRRMNRMGNITGGYAYGR